MYCDHSSSGEQSVIIKIATFIFSFLFTAFEVAIIYDINTHFYFDDVRVEITSEMKKRCKCNDCKKRVKKYKQRKTHPIIDDLCYVWELFFVENYFINMKSTKQREIIIDLEYGFRYCECEPCKVKKMKST